MSVMAEIPITIVTPGLHTHKATDVPEYPFGNLSTESPVSVTNIRPGMTSHSTQTDIEDFEGPSFARRQSPIHSRSTSQTRKPAHHQSWAEQIRTRLASPHSHQDTHLATDAAGHPLLAPPGQETPKRPATPRADLYRGQEEASFGMTFDGAQNVHMRKAKPTPCAFKYEDQKHRMMMDWLERRGTY